MTEEKFIELMKEDSSGSWKGDNALQGIQIIAKYIDPAKKSIIQGAGHDVIWCSDISDLIEAGITEEDVAKLRGLNWMLEDDSYLACFV